MLQTLAIKTMNFDVYKNLILKYQRFTIDLVGLQFAPSGKGIRKFEFVTSL